MDGNTRQNHFTLAFGELASSNFPHWYKIFMKNVQILIKSTTGKCDHDHDGTLKVLVHMTNIENTASETRDILVGTHQNFILQRYLYCKHCLISLFIRF